MTGPLLIAATTNSMLFSEPLRVNMFSSVTPSLYESRSSRLFDVADLRMVSRIRRRLNPLPLSSWPRVGYFLFAFVLTPAVSVKRMASSSDISTGSTAERGTSTI